MRLSLLIGFTAAVLTASIAPASAAGKWVLAWWREKGYYENCGGMCQVIHVYLSELTWISVNGSFLCEYFQFRKYFFEISEMSFSNSRYY